MGNQSKHNIPTFLTKKPVKPSPPGDEDFFREVWNMLGWEYTSASKDKSNRGHPLTKKEWKTPTRSDNKFFNEIWEILGWKHGK